MDYDTQEAIEILAKAREAMDPDSTQADRRIAADALFAALVNAAESAGLKAGRDERMTMVWYGEKKVCFDCHDGTLRVQTPGGPFRPVPRIEFDPATKMFRGMDDEWFRKQVPGEPAQKRSAVTILAEQATLALRR